MKFCVFLLVGLFGITNVFCAKILGVFSMTSKSHHILGSALLRALAERGHDVTMISPFSEKSSPKNGSYRDIVLTGFMEEHEKRMKEMNFFMNGNPNVILMATFFGPMMLNMTENTLSHPNVQKLINSNEKFDVVIVQQFMNEALKAFANHFEAPLITFTTSGAGSWINPLVGNPTPLSFVSEALLGYPSAMTFGQRLKNVLMHNYINLINYLYIFPQQGKLVKKYFSKDFNLDEIMYNSSLVLVNSHPSTSAPVPYVPNMIDIGGFHITSSSKPPADLQNFLDNATEGVIYFSMGSNIKSASLPRDKRDALLQTFSKLKVKVLWKWEEDVLPGQPPNVFLGKWLPQQEILAHPNVKVFITHGGLLSTIETIYHGVPVLAIPMGADQFLNAQNVVNQGFGLRLDYNDISEATLTQRLNELLNNPKFAENAKRRSEVFHDRIVPPMETAIYWVEYVIRHRGAPHLRIAGLDLPWYKYFLLDVILVLAVASVIGLYVVSKIVKKLFSLCCKKEKIKIKIK